MNRKPTVVSLYSGAGGLDLGFEAAGFETRVAIELDHDSVETLKANRPQWNPVETDVRSSLATSRNILRVAGLRVGEPDVLIAGPPCQPFSKSGYWLSGDSRRLSDPRSQTLNEFLRVLEDLQPRAFLLENVPGLSFIGKSEGLELLDTNLTQINRRLGTRYECASKVLRATEFGVPQERSRLFIVGARDGAAFVFPEGDYAAPRSITDLSDQLSIADFLENVSGAGLRPFFTAWDAIGDLEHDDDPELRPKGKWADLIPTIPEGQNYLFHTPRGNGKPLFGWRRCYWSFLLKLAKQLPSWTIAAAPGPAIGPFHWRNRRLSRQELMRLQTFPRDYKVIGNAHSAQRQLGNAVPSALAERLALEIARQILGLPVDPRRHSALLPKRRLPVPAPDKPRRVPRRFLSMARDVSDHPGVGRGLGALRRNSDTAGLDAGFFATD
jgi:DNA (cytosine-5)-methyltransferase 1